MKFSDRTLRTPAENLACDEALLDLAETSGEEFLRVWESPEPFVVVGYGNRIASEVNVEACASRGIPVLRRCSGGGTVVQGPGCLSYAVCLQAPAESPLATVTGTNRFVMERMAEAMATLLGRNVSVQGCTDLALQSADRWVKFSGNAQRRRRRALLFHGTILYNFNVNIISELLHFPSKQPDYRANRQHLDFVANIPVMRVQIVAALQTAWNAAHEMFDWPDEEIRTLAEQRYGNKEWNER